MRKQKCMECGAVLHAYWLKNGKCNGCRNPHLIVRALTDPQSSDQFMRALSHATQDPTTALHPSDVPSDHPVRPVNPDTYQGDCTTCGTCGLSWDDSIVTSMTPAPSARCPFELFHKSALERFIDDNRADMLEDLTHLVADRQDDMRADPDLYTGSDDDGPCIDVRLCIDLCARDDSGTWIFRTGLADYDPAHSEFCGARCIDLGTDPASLLDDLLEQMF